MPTPRTPSRRRWVATAASTTAALCALLSGLAPGVAEAKPAAPQLSIDIGNGRASTKAGDKLHYTITVENLGTSATQLVVTQSVPTGAAFGTADGRAQLRADMVSWPVQVKAGGKTTLHSTLTVEAGTPADLLRLASVTCAKVGPKGPPLVCASDSDLLPAGRAAQQAAAAAKAAPGSLLVGRPVSWLAAGVTLAVAALTATVMFRRRAGLARQQAG